jgi:hypothetical protein
MKFAVIFQVGTLFRSVRLTPEAASQREKSDASETRPYLEGI